MNYAHRKTFLLLMLTSIQMCYGIGEDLGINSAKGYADAHNKSTQKLVTAAKDLAVAIDAGGKQLEVITMHAADAAKNVGINAAKVTAETAEMVTETVKQVSLHTTRIAWIGIALAATYVTCYIGTDIYNRYNKWRNNKAMYEAKKALLNGIINYSHNKEGLFGFPEDCEKEVGNLLALPGGNNELEKIRGLLIISKAK